MTRISAILFFMALGYGGNTFAQGDPDSVIIRFDQFYASWGTGEDGWLAAVDCVDYSYPAKFIKGKNGYRLGNRVIPKVVMRRIKENIENPRSTSLSIANFDVDTTWIKSHAGEIFKKNRRARDNPWNQRQMNFMTEQLADISNYEKTFRIQLDKGCCYAFHNNYRDIYNIKMYEGGKITAEITSRKRRYGTYLPWVNSKGDTLTDFGIERDLNLIIPLKNHQAPVTGDRLLKSIARDIIIYNGPTLYKLSAYTYHKEILELESDFKIISFEEIPYRGRYIWDEDLVIKVVLSNELMHRNVRLNFIASGQGKTIYSRDSIKGEYREIVNRVQSIAFMKEFIDKDTAATLDIYYYNNKGINEYNIKGITEKTNRFKRSDLKKAIFLEFRDGNRNSSIWFLLPDNNILLYIMEGEKVLHFDRSEFGGDRGLLFPCVLFDSTGKRVD